MHAYPDRPNSMPLSMEAFSSGIRSLRLASSKSESFPRSKILSAPTQHTDGLSKLTTGKGNKDVHLG